jgi:phytoene dehydrogenase-like protein
MQDVIVIGNDLSSLITALISAYRGKKTTLIREQDVPCFFSEEGYTFDTCPLPWGGIGPGNALTNFLGDIGISYMKSNAGALPLQVVLSDHRIDLCKNLEHAIGEIEREFPSDSEKAGKLCNEMIKVGSFLSRLAGKVASIERNSAKRSYLTLAPAIMFTKIILYFHLKGIKDSSLKRALEAVCFAFSSPGVKRTDPLCLSHTLFNSLSGTYWSSKGRHYLMNSLRKRYELWGGRTINTCDVLRLKTAGGISVDVKTGDEVSTVSGKDIAISVKWRKIATILRDRRFSSLAKKLRKLESSSSYPLTVYMGVLEKGVPEMISENVIYVTDEKKSFINGNLLLIKMSPANDGSCAPEGRRAMSVTTFIEHSPAQLNDTVLRHAIDVSMKNLKGFLPFLEENTDFINIEESINISRKYQETVNWKCEMKRHPAFGPSIHANRTPMKNVFINGGELMPFLGLEGEVISGINAAKLIDGAK